MSDPCKCLDKRHTLNLAIFTHEESENFGRNLIDSISACHIPQSVQRIRAIADLEAHLKHPGENNRGKEILVLLAESRERLEQLSGLGDLLEDSRLILVVPDETPGTLSTAHRLFPRFVAPMANGYDELCSVIQRMMDSAENHR